MGSRVHDLFTGRWKWPVTILFLLAILGIALAIGEFGPRPLLPLVVFVAAYYFFDSPPRENVWVSVGLAAVAAVAFGIFLLITG